MKTILCVILGWALNVVSIELQNWEHAELINNALDMGIERRVKGYKGDQISKYVERNRSKIFDYINFKPNLWYCRWTFKHDKCLLPFLIRKLTKSDHKPTYKGTYE